MAKYYGRERDIVNPPASYKTSTLVMLYNSDFTNSVAKGRWTAADGFLLEKGSFIRKENTCSTNKSIKPIQDKLLKDKYLQNSDHVDYYLLTEDIRTSSPSSSACLVFGNDRTGYKHWQTKEGERLPKK